MEEAKLISEIAKPEFKKEIVADIKGVQTIENNIKEVQEYAIKLSEYYKGIKFRRCSRYSFYRYKRSF